MARDGIQLSGFKELDQALGQLKQSTERALLRRVATKALKPLAETAKAMAPVDSGHLRDSIVIGTNLTRGARRQAKKEPKGGVTVFAGTADRNAVPREFGTFERPAHPFMRPAFDSTQSQVIATVERELVTEIERTAKRAAKGKK